MLTDTAVRKAKPVEKPYKMADAGGLFLLVTTAGGRLWRLKYRFAGKEKLLALGAYPAVSLIEARAAREEAKVALRDGRDPSVARDEARAEAKRRSANTFEALAREWHALNQARWEKHHATVVLGSLEQLVFPDLGKKPIREIKSQQVLEVIRKIEARPAPEKARQVRQRISSIFVYAISTARADSDPASPLKGAMAPVKKRHQPAVTTLEEARQVLRDAEAKPGHVVTRLALRLLALTALRPGVIREAPWDELRNLQGENRDIWVIPAHRMKMRREFLLPLSRQALDTIALTHTLTGDGPLAFPNSRNAHKPMSENAISYMLNRAGYHGQHVPHGWRAAFSTIMNERLRADREIIDLMLAHTSNDPVEAAYNRSAYLDRRRELAQLWADLLLEGFPAPSDLLSLRRKSPNRALSDRSYGSG